MWQFAGGQTYSLVMKMGEMGIMGEVGLAEIQVVIITDRGMWGPKH